MQEKAFARNLINFGSISNISVRDLLTNIYYKNIKKELLQKSIATLLRL
ncbi:hypothetical protein HMPREF0628_1310 [Peptoniphilus lacrimalis 315-B]|uniref:Uncharacterized protein n=1 Tax=Peptoniphilus lacrimalis 315-B TaxID=596330 RepID=D1VVM6_9FIRM|nr:hypothetical protein HMPREF0628_1310 [Peptoniphilus lacrimalis 315-B]